MPFFKRRNAVKAKHGKNVPKQSPIDEDETSVISEVNSMLNELVVAVSDHTDSMLNIDSHENATLNEDVPKNENSSRANDECSSPVSANSTLQQKDTFCENDKCSSSNSKTNISEHSAQENDIIQSVTQEKGAVKQTDSTQETDASADAIQTNDISKDSDISNESCTCTESIDVAKLSNSSEENVKSSVQINNALDKSQMNPECSTEISDISSNHEKRHMHENIVKIDDMSNQTNPIQINVEDSSKSSTNNVSKEINFDGEKYDHLEPVAPKDISQIAKKEMDDSDPMKNDSSEIEPAENVPVCEKKILMKKTRSSSESESKIESQTKYVRRKFGSEAEIMSICQKILPPEQQKDINEAVAKYIDNLIKESIFKAVQGINVDNLCEELMKDASNRKSSQSTESEEDFVVEQRLSSNSISELVELQNIESKTNESEKDSFSAACEDKCSDTESVKNETGDTDNASFAGYLADLEDTASFDDLKSAEEDSLCNSSSSDLQNKLKSLSCYSQNSENAAELEFSEKTSANELTETTALNEQTIIDESNSLCDSSNHELQNKSKSHSCNSESTENTAKFESTEKIIDNETSKSMAVHEQIINDESNSPCSSTNHELQNEKKSDSCNTVSSGNTAETKSSLKALDYEQNIVEGFKQNEITYKGLANATIECVDASEKNTQIVPENNLDAQEEENHISNEEPCSDDKTLHCSENVHETEEDTSYLENMYKMGLKIISPENSEISLKSLDDSLLMKNDFRMEEIKNSSQIKRGSLPNPDTAEEERLKINWRVGYLHVKLPHKSRGKTSLKAWKKRRVVIQPDEFVNDPTNQSLMISVYSSRKHEATFWYSVSSQKAVVFRSSSHSHRYAFTISEGGQAIIHISAENESETQEWITAIRAVLWPPSPFMELEKMLSGQEFEVSIIDNEFSYHAGLLGMYGYLSITPKKLILLHPQQGYVIQEWYLNTVDKFQFVLQQKPEDMHKVLCMTTCKDSSTGQGDIIFFCKDAVTLLQTLASTIHQVLSYHSKQEGGKYQKELEELAEWMVAPPRDCLKVENDEHYKVPPRQVKSLLDIPNFIFNKPLSPVASAIYPAPNSEVMEATLDATKNKLTNTSQDSGISNCTNSEDFLNCSTASFVVGGGPMTGKSSDSELSDAYSPPRTPEIIKKKIKTEVVKEEPPAVKE